MTPATYSIDGVKIRNIYNLEFIDTSNTFIVSSKSFNEMSLKVRLQTLIKFQQILDVCGGKGYLATIDLSTFSLYADLLPFFITEMDPTKACLYINGDKSMESFK